MNEVATSTALSPSDIEQLMDSAEHINGEHPDTVTFVANFAGSWPDVRDARIVGVDERGVTFEVNLDSGSSERRSLDFDSEAATLEAVQASVQALLGKARELAPESIPLTSMEQEISELAALPTFHSTVTRIRDLNPRYREITFAGGLDEFSPGAPDQFLLVILAGTDMSQQPSQAYYTVRSWRPTEGELDMWFVLHDHRGPISGWAAQAEPGDTVSLWGPRSSFDPPPGASSLLLVADDTGVPAVATILESTDLPAHVILETYDTDHVVDLPVRENIDVRWLYRDGDEPGASGRLLDAVSRLDISLDGVYAFGAGESREITAVRKYLRRERGMDRESVHMTGYWRRG